MEQKTPKKKISIKTKLLSIILLVVAIIIVSLTIVSYQVSKHVITDYSENLLSSSIENQANEIESWLNENLAAFQIVKKTIEGIQPEDGDLQRILDQYYGFNANFPEGIYIADGQGKLLKAAESEKTEKNPTNSIWYTQGLTRINMGFTSAYTNENGAAVISASGILKDGSGRQRVISADMTLQRISIIVNSKIEMKNAQAFLVSTVDDTILAHRDTDLISTSLTASSDDSFLGGVEKKLTARDYEMTEIDGNLTVFQKIEGTDWLLVSYIPNSIVYADVNRVRNAMLIIGILSLLLLAVLIERVVHMVIRPIKELTNVITRMTDGDFTVTMKSRGRDEIGIMGSGVEKFLVSMRSMLASIHEVSGKLGIQADESYKVSKELQDSSIVQSQSMQELSFTVGQLSDSVNEIAENATTLAGVVSDTREDSHQVEEKMRETVDISTQGQKDMSRIEQAMNIIQNSINGLKAAIDKVGEASHEITAITAVIAEIADETNLLSLNATIEAARAGEAGAGFAVVATQIGKLAQTSAESVQTIENLIQQINEQVADCVTQADGSVENINESSKLIEAALVTFDRIFDNIGIANHLVESMIQKIGKVDDVATNMAAISEEQAASSEEILATSETMVEQAESISGNSGTVAEDSGELARSSEELADHVNRFKV